MRGLYVGLVVFGLVSAGCNMIPGFGGGGDEGGTAGGVGFVMPATSPYMYAQDLSDYQAGRWVHYKTDMSGQASESTIKVVGKEGDNLWVQVGMIVSGMDNTHLMLVQPDRKVVKAYFSGKDDKEWRKADINEVETPAATGGETADVDVKESDESKAVSAGEFACHRIDATVQGTTSTTWYCKEVFQLDLGGTAHGGVVAMESSTMKKELAGIGEDAKPKHEIPAEE